MGLEGVAPSFLCHFREKGEARITPFGRVPRGVLLPSWVGVVGCVEPLDKGLVPPTEERPPNLGSLDTMADLMDAFSSIRCQQRHVGNRESHTTEERTDRKTEYSNVLIIMCTRLNKQLYRPIQ